MITYETRPVGTTSFGKFWTMVHVKGCLIHWWISLIVSLHLLMTPKTADRWKCACSLCSPWLKNGTVILMNVLNICFTSHLSIIENGDLQDDNVSWLVLSKMKVNDQTSANIGTRWDMNITTFLLWNSGVNNRGAGQPDPQSWYDYIIQIK